MVTIAEKIVNETEIAMVCSVLEAIADSDNVRRKIYQGM